MYDAIYARQSIDKKDSISIESQISMCEHETRGNTFKTYTDKGYSGKNLDRPDFERLTEDIKNGLVKKVIVYKLDRISRSILDFSSLMLFFEKYDVEFVSTTEKFDTSTPVGRAMLNICIVFAQLERETIQQRVFDAYHSRNKQGFFMGGRIPYGFRIGSTVLNGKKTSKYVAHELECSQIKLMYSMYVDSNYSLSDVRQYLMDNDMQPIDGRAWCASRISEVLSNPAYVKSDLAVYEFFKSQGATIINDASEFDGRGFYIYNDPAAKSGKRKRHNLASATIVLAQHEGIVSSEDWIKCRLRCLSNRRSTKTCKGKSSWLVGKTKCVSCGYAIVMRKSKSKWGRYCICSTKEATKTCKGLGGTVYTTVVEEYIFNAIKDKLSEFKTLSDYEKKGENPKIRDNDLKIIKIDNEINDLLTKVAGANAILMDYINNKVSELDVKRKDIQQENISIQQAIKGDKLNSVYNHVQSWDKTSFEDKTSVVDILIKVIHIGNGEIVITWNV